MTYPYEYQLANNLSSNQAGTKRPSPLLKIFAVLGIAIISLIAVAAFHHEEIYNFICIGENNETAATLPEEIESSEQPVTETETLYESNFKASLNQSEKDVIHLLRLEVEDKVPHNFMKTDSYLIRWLKAREWDVEEAKKMLLEHLDWRVEYDMDNVLKDNLTYFDTEYPLFMDGLDYRGGPVASMNNGDWDLRKISAAGNQRDFLRYMFSHFEKAIKYIADCQAKGSNVSQAMIIMNLAKFNMKQQGCYSCLPHLYKFVFGLDDHYPGWLHTFILINVPDFAEVVLDLLIPYLSGDNKEAFQMYGFNKQEWQPKILSVVAPDQIRTEFGGTKADTDL